jgi:hypothetical protein
VIIENYTCFAWSAETELAIFASISNKEWSDADECIKDAVDIIIAQSLYYNKKISIINKAFDKWDEIIIYYTFTTFTTITKTP